jgi:hypothetical protein
MDAGRARALAVDFAQRFCDNRAMSTKLFAFLRAWRRVAMLACALAAVPAQGAEDSRLPPSWRTPPSPRRGGRTETTAELTPPRRPWYEPRAALGVGLNVPEVLPFEGFLFFGRYFGLRLFFTPQLPLNIRIEMPSDVISTKKGIGVANPDFTIRMKAYYGPNYGAEALVFPFGGSFFIGAGASYRKLRLVGSAKSPILICSLIEAAKEPPCGDADAAIKTETQLELKADATTAAVLARGGLGWFWHVGRSAYLMFNAGLTKPTRISRSVSVEANVDSPGDDDDVSGALSAVKAEREADLEDKALKEIRPVEEKTLPILGLSAGIRF